MKSSKRRLGEAKKKEEEDKRDKPIQENPFKSMKSIKIEPNFAVLSDKKFKDFYNLDNKKILGKGSFGVVYECTLKNVKGK